MLYIVVLCSVVKFTSLVVFGDSLSIISWACGKTSLNVLLLKHWMDAAQKLIRDFEHLHFEHVFRKANMEADMLSKRALHSQAGVIMWQEWREDTLFSQGSYHLHWS